LLYWILFNLFALGLLALDLRMSRRRGQSANPRAALRWSAFYVSLAAVFAVLVYFWQGHQAALEFVTGYVLEFSLSIDNLFLFLVIFNYFAVPEERQRRVLFWGVVGAIALRGLFIGTGVGLLRHFHGLFYILGALLIYSGIRLSVMGDHRIDPAANPLVKALRRWMPVTPDYRGSKFFVRNPDENFRLYATPLLVVLLVIETTDFLFAVDSVPAVLAVTLNAFIVYSSNVLAILGLRSLYFAVSRLMQSFRFLHYGLAAVLMLTGAKMICAKYVHVPTAAMLGLVASVLLISVLASVAVPAEKKME
jgi:TerC family integral membrane protein